MKRTIDILVSSVALIVLLPVFLLIGAAVWMTSPGGVFFHQVRVGRGGIPFNLLKFRSMIPGSESQGQITVGGRDPRITRLGYYLRKSKLDELPQLINVLKGDMSIVGPRPEVSKYVALYDPEQRLVLTMRPGLTSQASITYIDENERLGRSSDPEHTYLHEIMPAKLALDLEYVRNYSLMKDLRIVLATCARILGSAQ